MKRFKIEDWVDYARGVADEKRKAEMQKLLDEGCEGSQRLLQTANMMAEAAQVLGKEEPPTGVLQRAYSIFEQGQYKAVSRIPLSDIRLIFDSMLEPQLAGVRATETLIRETTYMAGKFLMSMRMEQEGETEVMAVVGQLSIELGAKNTVSKRPVYVYQKNKLIARTLTGENGEFQMEFSKGESLKLVLLVENPEERIEVDLVPASTKKLKRNQDERDR
jgi:hypothetical protein